MAKIKTVNGRETRERILDAAEDLFAGGGYHGTSMRKLTGEASVNLAAVNYHFGTKEDLLREVLRRRIEPLNEMRMKRLRIVKERSAASGDRPEVVEIIAAFVEPVLTMEETGAGTRAFKVLVGRILAEPDRRARDIFMEYMSDTLRCVLGLLYEALPHLSQATVDMRLLLGLGAMSRILCLEERVPLLSEGVSSALDAPNVTKGVISFITAGMTSP